MSVSLAVLADRLQRSVPQRNGAPADYEQLVIEAVAQFSQDLPIIAATTLALVAGTASYALPPDFLYAIDFAAPPIYGDVLIANQGIIPLAGGLTEAHYIEGDSVRFDPVPAYSTTRTVRYAAAHSLAGGMFPRLSENGARIALLYAQYLALNEQANASAGDGWSYKIGDESVDKRGLAAAIQTQAGAALDAYNAALRPLKGYGSQYKANPYAQGEV